MPSALFTAFEGATCVARGSLPEVARVLKRAHEAGATEPLQVFDDQTGRALDLNLRGSDAALQARVQRALQAHAPASPAPAAAEPETEPRGRGRPRLGVVAREVTLLPRHWDWLAAQPGGASVALRKLVETAIRQPDARAARLRCLERAYHFMSAMAGDLAGFEEASRALFADDGDRLRQLTAGWPHDVREHLWRLAANEGGVTTPE